MGLMKRGFQGSQAVLSMVVVQVLATGLQLLSRVILNEGAFIFALIAYRHVVAAFCVAPFAFFYERRNERKLSWSVCFWLFLSALTGIIMAMGLFYYGLRDTTATYATNFLNLIPVVTFVFSTIVRIEKLGLQTRAGKIKVAGAILCLAGALTISLYKGKAFHIGGHHNNTQQQITTKSTTNPNWTRGSFFLAGSCLSYASWFIVQAKLFKVFPSKYWGTMLTCIIASIQSTVIAICLDRRTAVWRLGWNLELVTIIYSGSLVSATSFCLISWAITNQGPTYPPMFNPLSLIFVAILEVLLFGEDMRVGSLVGMVLIIVGLYYFLWGRGNELRSLPVQTIVAGEVATIDPPDSARFQLTPTSPQEDDEDLGNKTHELKPKIRDMQLPFSKMEDE